jgi:hypothetical protein
MEINKKLKEYRDISADRVIYALVLPKNDYKLYKSYLNKSDGFYKQRDKEKIEEIKKKIFEQAQRSNLKEEQIEIICEDYLPKEFIPQMEKAYKIYNNPIHKTDDILKEIYQVSLCSNILDKRRRLLYKDVFIDFTKDHGHMLKDIQLYVDRYVNKKIICKKNIRYEYTYKNRKIKINGEMDMLNEEDLAIVDYKCSSNCKDDGNNIDWILQVLLYLAIERKENHFTNHQKNQNTEISKLEIFNPMMGKIYHYDIGKWNKDNEMLNLVCDIILREDKNQINEIENIVLSNNRNNNAEIMKNNNDVITKKKLQLTPIEYSDDDIEPNLESEHESKPEPESGLKLKPKSNKIIILGTCCNVCNKVMKNKGALISHLRKKVPCLKDIDINEWNNKRNEQLIKNKKEPIVLST